MIMNPKHEDSGCAKQKETMPLFEPFVQNIVHRDDPETSTTAAEKFVQSGGRNKWHQRILEVLKRHDRPNGYTTKELAFLMCGDDTWQGLYFKIAKRMRELENKGLIVECPVRESLIGGGEMCTWRAK